MKASSRKFVELLEPIRDQLYRYARRAAWRSDDAPDLIQESVMTAWRKFDSFEQGTNFRAWMFQVLINTVYNFNRRVRRQREVTLEAPELELAKSVECEDAWAELLSRPPVLSELVDGRIARAMERLGHDERSCLLLRLIEGFNYKEISALLEMPLGTVMSHVHRARMKLRQDLAALAVERGLVRESVA